MPIRFPLQTIIVHLLPTAHHTICFHLPNDFPPYAMLWQAALSPPPARFWRAPNGDASFGKIKDFSEQMKGKFCFESLANKDKDPMVKFDLESGRWFEILFRSQN